MDGSRVLVSPIQLWHIDAVRGPSTPSSRDDGSVVISPQGNHRTGRRADDELVLAAGGVDRLHLVASIVQLDLADGEPRDCKRTATSAGETRPLAGVLSDEPSARASPLPLASKTRIKPALKPV